MYLNILHFASISCTWSATSQVGIGTQCINEPSEGNESVSLRALYPLSSLGDREYFDTGSTTLEPMAVTRNSPPALNQIINVPLLSVFLFSPSSFFILFSPSKDFVPFTTSVFDLYHRQLNLSLPQTLRRSTPRLDIRSRLVIRNDEQILALAQVLTTVSVRTSRKAVVKY